MIRRLFAAYLILVAGLACLWQASAQMIPLTGAGGKFRAAVAGGGPTTVYGPITLTTSDGSWVNTTLVQLLNASNLAAATGTQVRLTLKFSNIGFGNTAAVYIAQQATSGDAWDFLNTPAHVLFGGVDITGDGSTVDYVSDWVNLPEAYDETKNYLIAVGFSAGGSLNLIRAASTGDQNWFNGDPSAAPTVNKGVFIPNLTDTVDLITKVEIQ